MRIRILSSAVEDIHLGRVFYEDQGEGPGEYFFDSLFSDIDSLVLYAGIHPKVFGYYRLLSKRFPYAVTTRSTTIWRLSGECLIFDATPTESVEHSNKGEQSPEPYL